MQTRIHGATRMLSIVFAWGALSSATFADDPQVASPDGRTVVAVGIRDGGLFYTLKRDGKELLRPSRLGFAFRGAPMLRDSLRIVNTSKSTFDETWTQPWGEVAKVRDHHNEMRVSVQETGQRSRKFEVVVRAFNDGIGFRYEIPAQDGLNDVVIQDELTEFNFADNPKAWWIPSDHPRLDRSEMLWSSSPVSRLDSVQTPITTESTDGKTFMVIHEANLVDYPRMFLAGWGLEGRTLVAALAPMHDGVKVRAKTPLVTPWRTIQIADRAIDLAPSVLGLNLNPPNKLGDVSWVKPMKYVGIWWGMHINTDTWNSGPKHGATTAQTKRYIDFAAANGLGGVLVEGWNIGWDGNWIDNRNAFSFTKPYPDYDLPGLAAYAKSKNVRIIVHNETSGGIENYENQMDDAFKLYNSLGLDAIKSGYVTDTLSGGHSHYSQFAVRHHRHVLDMAAKYHIGMVVHEPIHDTGERRTYPNMMSREGARGQEYNAWSGDGGNPPEHETILFFTRMLTGPMDFTPGIFDILIKRPTGTARGPEDSHPRTTLAKQLALYVVLWSPVQMAADLIENYANQPAFQFIRDVAVNWEQTKVLNGKIGDYVIVARQQRSSPDWFIGAITDEESRTFDVPLSFLPAGKSYVAEIYADGPGASGLTNPLPIVISKRTVTSASHLSVKMAPGGGQAIRLHAVK
ncbi:MAG: glycoside hydrolase family 97 protein [Gemmatimonadales bacterium]